MIKININGMEFELAKSKYQDNNRLAIIIFEPANMHEYTLLTVNLPEYMLSSDMFSDDKNGQNVFLNHLDYIAPYDNILNQLVENNYLNLHNRIQFEKDEISHVESAIFNVVKSGFNNYYEIEFKSEIVNQMRNYQDLLIS